MPTPPKWFKWLVAIALAWNVAGVLGVAADMRLSAADIAALPANQQALYAARPFWSVVASVVAVGGGTLGCLGLLMRRRWALVLLYLSLVGIVVQDIGIFLVAGRAGSPGLVAAILQGLVLVIGMALVALARRANGRSWLS